MMMMMMMKIMHVHEGSNIFHVDSEESLHALVISYSPVAMAIYSLWPVLGLRLICWHNFGNINRK